MSDPQIPACSHWVRESEYRVPTNDEFTSLRPCGYCFSDGDIEVRREETLVSDSKHGEVVHRQMGVDGVASHGSKGGGVSNLAKQLEREDITAVDDIDFDRAFGDEGGEA